MRPKLRLEVPAAPDRFPPKAGPGDDRPALAQAYPDRLETLNIRAAREFPGLDIEVRSVPGQITTVRQNGRGEVEWNTLDAVLDWVESDRNQGAKGWMQAQAQEPG